MYDKKDADRLRNALRHDQAVWREQYKRSPMFLTRDVSILLTPMPTDPAKVAYAVGERNKIISEILAVCPNREKLFKNITNAIIDAMSDT